MLNYVKRNDSNESSECRNIVVEQSTTNTLKLGLEFLMFSNIYIYIYTYIMFCNIDVCLRFQSP